VALEGLLELRDLAQGLNQVDDLEGATGNAGQELARYRHSAFSFPTRVRLNDSPGPMLPMCGIFAN